MIIHLHPSENSEFLSEHAQSKLNSSEVTRIYSLWRIPATCFILFEAAVETSAAKLHVTDLSSSARLSVLFKAATELHVNYTARDWTVCLQLQSLSLLQVRSTTWAALRCIWAVRRWACPHLSSPGRRWVSLSSLINYIKTRWVKLWREDEICVPASPQTLEQPETERSDFCKPQRRSATSVFLFVLVSCFLLVETITVCWTDETMELMCIWCDWRRVMKCQFNKNFSWLTQTQQGA